MRRLKKKIYIGLVSSTVLVLALVRCVNPSVVRVYQHPADEAPADTAAHSVQNLLVAESLEVNEADEPDSSQGCSKLLYLAHTPTRFVTDSLGRLSRTEYTVWAVSERNFRICRMCRSYPPVSGAFLP